MIFWIMAALSKDYEGEIELDIRYKNLPPTEAFASPPTDQVRIRIKGTGWKLLANYMDANINAVSVDMTKYKQANSISTSLLHSLVSKSLPMGTTVLSIEPELIQFSHDTRITKKVPVVLDASQINFERGFDQIGEVVIEPDSINVSGPEAMVSRIDSWETTPIEGNAVKETIELAVDLKSITGTTLELSANVAQVRIPVEQLTEGTVQVRILTKNAPKDVSVVIIPNSVNLSFQVALSQFEAITEDLFVVYADFAGVDLSSNQKIMLSVDRQPSMIKNLNLTPAAVEYIVYK
jgi:YbbR domain-containing protein